MTWAIYSRVSTIDQHPENQRLELERYAKAMGYTFKFYEEKESTRKTRPVKEMIMHALRKREFEGVLIWKLDRWARSTRELITDLDEMIHLGAKFMCLSFPVDISRPEGKMVATVIGAMAECEREWNRERTLLGIARKKSEGWTAGRPPGSKDKKPRKKSGYLLRWKEDSNV